MRKEMLALLGFLRKQVGLRSDPADAEGSLHAKTKDIKDFIANKDILIYGSVVKSVQRGTVQMNNSSKVDYNIAISSVNVDKAIVLHGGYLNGNADSHGVRVELTSSTNVRCSKGANWINQGFAWQVIEFY